MKRIIRLLVMCLITSNAFANGESGIKSVHEIYAMKDGVKIISSEGSWDNPDNCDVSSALVIPHDHLAYDALLSMALSIQARGIKLRAWVDGCFNWGGATYPQVWGISSYSN